MASNGWINLHTQYPEKYNQYNKYQPTVSTNY